MRMLRLLTLYLSLIFDIEKDYILIYSKVIAQ